MKWQVAVPAYGRDWAAFKDFRCEPKGGYINKEDADTMGIQVQIRYARLSKLVVIPPNGR